MCRVAGDARCASDYIISNFKQEKQVSTIREAHDTIHEFERRSTGTDWLRIKKDHLITGMRARLENPNLISTRVVDLCGPAAFFRCLAEDDPVMYVKAIISLYETNSAWIGSRRFTAGQKLRMVPLGGIRRGDQ
jgi:hypothetical protein